MSPPQGGFLLPLLALVLGHVFSNAVRTLPAVAADLLTRDLAISAETLAAITGAFPAAFALAMIPVGVALDRYGVKPVSLTLLAISAGGCVVAAGALVPPGMSVPEGVVVMGSPAKVVRELKEDDRVRILRGAEVYRQRSALYRATLKPSTPGA